MDVYTDCDIRERCSVKWRLDLFCYLSFRNAILHIDGVVVRAYDNVRCSDRCLDRQRCAFLSWVFSRYICAFLSWVFRQVEMCVVKLGV